MAWSQDNALNTLWYSGTANETPTTSNNSVPISGSGRAYDGAVAINTSNGNMWARVNNNWQLIAGTGGGGAGSMANFFMRDHSGDDVEMDDGKYVKFINGGGVGINFTDVSTGSTGDPFDLTFTADVQTSNTVTLYNKTFSTPKILDNTSGGTYQLRGGSANSGTRNVYFPSLSNNDTFVLLGTTQTLTNKTLTTPTISATGWANANHNHSASTRGGTITLDGISSIADGTLGYVTYYNTAISMAHSTKIYLANSNEVTLSANLDMQHYGIHFNQTSNTSANDNVFMKAPADVVSGGWTFTLPENDGNAGQYLQTNGSGVTEWATVSGSGTVNSSTTNRVAYYSSSTAISGTNYLTLESSHVAFNVPLDTKHHGIYFEETGSGTDNVFLKAPAAVVSSGWTFLLPGDAGTGNYFLKTDGTGNTSWDNVQLYTGVVSNSNLDNTVAFYANGGAGGIAAATVSGTGYIIVNTSDVTFNAPIIMNDVDLKFEERGSGSELITIAAPTTINGSFTLTLPTSDGDANQVLQTNGSGALSWATAYTGSIGSAAGKFVAGYNWTSGGAVNDIMAYANMEFTDINTTTSNSNIVFSGNTLGIKFRDVGSDYITLKAPTSVDTGGYTFTLPSNDGGANNVLISDGSGNTSWAIHGGVNYGVAGRLAIYATSGYWVDDTTWLYLTNSYNNALVSNVNVYLESTAKLIFEETGSGSNIINIAAPATITTDFTLTLPVNDGNADQILKTDGSGNLGWVDQNTATISSGVSGRVGYYTGQFTMNDHPSMVFGAGSTPSNYEVDFYDTTADFNHHTDTRVVLPVGANKWAT